MLEGGDDAQTAWDDPIGRRDQTATTDRADEIQSGAMTSLTEHTTIATRRG